jgi:hypothetical protein
LGKKVTAKHATQPMVVEDRLRVEIQWRIMRQIRDAAA